MLSAEREAAVAGGEQTISGGMDAIHAA